jgi:hypothetical protein
VAKIAGNYLKAAGYCLIWLAALNAALIASYHWTFIDPVPGYTGESFVKTRIGGFSVEIPETFSPTTTH